MTEPYRPSRRLAARPCLAPGVELLGEYEGSGFSERQWLLRRSDGQVIQVSTLLYLVAQHADGRASVEDIADRVTVRFGRPVSAANVQFLLEQKLLPLGLIATADGATPAAPRADLLLGVRVRRNAVPEWLVNRLAVVLSPLFKPVVVALVLVSLAAFDVWLGAMHGVSASAAELIARPAWFLLVFGILVATSLATIYPLGLLTRLRLGPSRWVAAVRGDGAAG